MANDTLRTFTRRGALLGAGGVAAGRLLLPGGASGTVAPGGPARPMRLGINISSVDFPGTNVNFIDYFKCAGLAFPPAAADANGMPQKLAIDKNGNPGANYFLPVDDGRTKPVRYHWFHDGDMHAEMTGGRLVSGRQGEQVFEYRGGPWGIPGSGSGLNITSIRRPPTFMAFVREDEVPLWKAGRIFRPELIEAVKGFSYIRCMGWCRTNGSPTVDTFTPKNMLYYSGADGVPLEIQAALSRETGIPIWTNVPHLASDAWWAAARAKLHPLVGLGLPPIIEYSNEIWNFGFTQSAYALKRATAQLGPGAQPYHWTGIRSGQLAAQSRGEGFRWVVGGVPVMPFTWSYVTDGIRFGHGSISDFWGWTVNTYVGGTIGLNDGGPLQAAFMRRVHANDYAGLAQDLISANVIGPNHAYVATSVARMAQDVYRPGKAFADAHHLRLLAYEGNIGGAVMPSYVNDPEKIKIGEFLRGFMMSPYAAQVEHANLKAFEAAGGDGVMMFDLNGRPSDYGTYGLLGTPQWGMLKKWTGQSA